MIEELQLPAGDGSEVAFDGFGDNASFRKLYLADPGKSDPRTQQDSDGAHPQGFRVARIAAA